MSEYLVIYEDAGPNWAAYVPDLPGCIGVGATQAECEQNIAEGIEAYIQYLADEGQPVPVPASRAGYVKIA
jgi:predicted RNase H-like HicB family nuclease